MGDSTKKIGDSQDFNGHLGDKNGNLPSSMNCSYSSVGGQKQSSYNTYIYILYIHHGSSSQSRIDCRQLEWLFRSGYAFSKAWQPDPKAKVGLNPSWSSCGSIPSRWRCQHWWIWMPRAGNLSAILVGWCGRWTGELWWIFAPGIAHDPPRLDSYFTFWQFRTALSHVVGLGFYDPNQPYWFLFVNLLGALKVWHNKDPYLLLSEISN